MHSPIFARLVFALLSLSAPIQIRAIDAAAFATIRSVGAQGDGNERAASAWKEIAQADAASLVTILQAMDGANDHAVNWLRLAADAVAGRAVSSDKPLPLFELGKFLLDTSHHPKARRLAFDLIARVDAATADKLLSGMLNDPSMELRHDAVQKLVDLALRSIKESKPGAAAILFQQALAASRDPQQIDTIAAQLTELGHPVDVPGLFGFITRWHVVGPFDNTGNAAFEKVYPPEERIDLSAEYDGKNGKVRWQEFVTDHKYGMVDMNKPCGKLKEVMAYATTEFFSDRAQPVELRLGGKNSWKVWLNGKLLFGRDEYHTGSEIDQYIMPAQMRPGKNVILVKVCQNEMVQDWTNEWEFQLRVTDPLGAPVPPTNPAVAAPHANARNIKASLP